MASNIDYARTRAASYANGSGKPMIIRNLNRVGIPCYVIREYFPDCEAEADFVETIHPRPDPRKQ